MGSQLAGTSAGKVLLTVDEVAKALSVGRTYTYQLVMQQQIASIKVGRKRWAPVSALQEFINRCLAA